MTPSTSSGPGGKKPVPLFPPRKGAATHIQVAPGETIVGLPPAEVRRVAVCDLIPQGDHTYRAVARIHTEELALTPRNLRELNISIGVRTMSRLIKAGFVEGYRVSPSLRVFKVHSYYAHVERVRETEARGDEFWTPARLQTYRATY